MADPTPEDIKATYGFVALLAQQVPEIGALMQQAVSEKWTQERFQMAVANTNWWKTTPAPGRQWFTQLVADPATADRQLQTGGDLVGVMASKWGYNNINPQLARQLWLNAKLAGYDDQALDLYVFNHMRYFGGTNEIPAGGEYGTRILEATQLANQYGYPTDRVEQEVQGAMAEAIRAGQDRTSGMTAWRNKLINYASAKYAPFAERIQAGETVEDIARPYVDIYAQTLELNPNDIGLNDAYVQRWLQGQAEAGNPPAAPAVWQAQQELRKDPRWGYTQNARQTAAQVATTIGRAFGMIG